MAIQRLNDDWYNAATGIWDNAWWNSGSALATLADFTMLRLDVANQLNLGGIMRTTFTNAQKTRLLSVKTMHNGLVLSTYCLDQDEGCMAKRDFLGKRGFDDFINEFYDDEGRLFSLERFTKAILMKQKSRLVGVGVDSVS